MNTPAAKRRRVEATNTLRKPFRSPLISRRGVDNDQVKTSSEKEGDAGQSFKDASAGINIVQSAEASSSSSSPLATKVPRRAVGTWAPFKSPSVAVPVPAATGPRPKADHKPDGKRELGSSSEVTAGDRPSDLDAKRGNDVTAGAAADGDDELRHLIVKWKAASRLAAEMVFDVAKQRVDSAGGPKAWREQQKSWDDPASGTRGSDDGEGRELGSENHNSYEASSCGDDNEQISDDDDEPAFTMGTMLKAMNIDTAMLGYDEHEDAWID